MAFKRGKTKGISELLEGYEKIQKCDIQEPILIDNVIKGYSEDNGVFIYVTGTHQSVPVFVSIPAASVDDFVEITESDLDEIRSEGLKLYVESHMSKKGRQYYTAYIEE